MPLIMESENGRRKTTPGQQISIGSLQAELAMRAFSAGRQAKLIIRKDLHAALEVSRCKIAVRLIAANPLASACKPDENALNY